MSKINASIIQDQRRYHKFNKSLTSRKKEEFRLVKERYEKRIDFIKEKVIQLRSNKSLPGSGKAVRKMNEIENLFSDCVASTKEKILRRKLEFSEEISAPSIITKSLPEISLRHEQPVSLDSSMIGLRDFTETDKL